MTRGRDALMTHGWPGSVIDLLETVGPLTDPTGTSTRSTGGHFAAWEEPELFSTELRRAFSSLR